MKRLKIICILFCVLSLISTFTGLQSFHVSVSSGQTVNSSTSIVTTKNLVFKICTFFQAVFFGAIAYGIHQKARIVWKLGWVILILLSSQALVLMLSSSLKLPLPDRWIASSLILIGIGAVAVYCGFWWKRQKNYFY